MFKKLLKTCTALLLVMALLLTLLPVFAETVQASTGEEGNDILSFMVAGSLGHSILDKEKGLIRFHVPQASDRSNVSATVTLSPGATISPDPSVARSYSSAVTYTVTSASGVSKQWTVLAGYRAFPNDPFAAVTLHGENLPNVTKSIVPVSGQSFNQAYRIETVGGVGDNWNLVLRVPIPIAMPRNDALVLTYYVNPIEAVNEQSAVFLTSRVSALNYAQQQFVTPLSFPAGTGWTEVNQPFRNHTNVELNGNGYAHFALGFPDQKLEIGGLELFNYGNISSALLEKMPFFTPSYEGQSLDAPWRAEAAARIEQIRKNELTVEVKQSNGEPVANAQVNVRMTNHAFRFGTAVHPNQYFTNATYRQKVQELFNAAVVQNELKHAFIDRFDGRRIAANIVNRLHADGFKQSMHTLVWPFDKNNTEEIVNLKKYPALLDRRLIGHIESVMNMFPTEQIANWDVLNEAANGKDFQRVLGDSAMVRWFEKARQLKPNAQLVINDFDASSRYTNVLQYLKDHGIALDEVGYQGHYGHAGRNISDTQVFLDTLAQYGSRLSITEFDMLTINEDLYADWLRDVLTLSYAHPSMDAFYMWGFWDGQHWKNNAPLFKANWTPKKPLQEWKRLVFTEWWTNESGVTDDAGQFKLRGYHGDYEVDITIGGTTKTYRTNIAGGSPTLLVVQADSPASSNTSLVRLEFDGQLISGFTPQQHTYTVQIPYGQSYSGSIYAQAADQHAKVTYHYPDSVPGSATVTVRAQDGSIAVYTIQQQYAPLTEVAGLKLKPAGVSALGTVNPQQPAEYAIDGSRSTSWSGGSSITVDLGGIQTISGINLAWNKAEPNHILIETSVDGTTGSWWTVGSLQTPGASTEAEPYSFKDLDFGYTDVFGRYVRVQSVSGALTGITELDVFGAASEAALSSIHLDGAALSGFAPSTKEYIVELSGPAAPIPTVTVVPAKAGATWSIVPAQQVPGVTSIHVQAANGNTETYQVTFVPQRLIGDLLINGQSLPEFQPERYEYTISVPAGTTELPDISVTKAKPDAEISIISPAKLPGVYQIKANRMGYESLYKIFIEFEGAPRALQATEVTASSVSLNWTAPIVQSSSAIAKYVDDFDDLDRIVEKSDTWRIDTQQALPTSNGDPSRLVRSELADFSFFTHKIPNSKGFAAELFTHNAQGYYNGDNIRVYVSPDNETWTRITLSHTPYVVSFGGWRASTFSNGASIPPGMNYVKWEFYKDGFKQAWSPMIGRLTVDYDPNAPFYHSYEVYDGAGHLVQTVTNTTTRATVAGLEADEAYQFYVVGVDQYGNRSPQSNSVSVRTAALPPLPNVTQAIVTPAANASGWHNSDIIVTLDAAGASQADITVTSITYSLIGAQQAGPIRALGQSASFEINAEGVTSVEYYARTAEGRKEPQQTKVFKLDKTAPVIQGDVLYRAPLTERTVIHVTAADEGSGIASVQATFNGEPVSLPLVIEPLALKPGMYILEVTAIDLAGNLSRKSIEIKAAIDISQLDPLLDLAYEKGWIKNRGIYTALKAIASRLSKDTANQVELLRELNTLEHSVKAMQRTMLDPKFSNDLLDIITYLKSMLQS